MRPTPDQLSRVARYMRQEAVTGFTDGHLGVAQREYLARCRRVVYGTTVIFTRDTGMHSSGWLKNPDYERCLHLSLSPAPGRIWTPDTPDLDRKLTAGWLQAFFGEHRRYALAESPKSEAGKRVGVWHWRVFCDAEWNPYLPRGEVYSTELTELGWKSASELGVTIESNLGANP